MEIVDTKGWYNVETEVFTMERLPRGKYTKEFREEAVKLVMQGGLSIPEASRRLLLSSTTLSNWVKAYKAGKLAEVGKGYRPLSEVEVELGNLRRELARVKMERDILKKAAAYFAKESQEGTR
jgi:transposase